MSYSDNKCYCDCHKHPGAYRCEPCHFCGHYNSEGSIVGGIVYGYWVKNKGNEKDNKGKT